MAPNSKQKNEVNLICKRFSDKIKLKIGRYTTHKYQTTTNHHATIQKCLSPI